MGKFVGSFALRAAALGFQLVNLSLIPDLLSSPNLGTYYLILSVVSLLAPFVDLGFIRYAYKYVDRFWGFVFFPIYNAVSRILLLTIPTCAVFLAVYFWSDSAYLAAIFGLLAVTASRLLQLHKYFLVRSGRPALAVAFELISSGLMSAILIIALAIKITILEGTHFTLLAMVALYSAAIFITYLSSFCTIRKIILAQEKWRSWARKPLAKPKRLIGHIRRTFLVALDAALTVQIVHLPMLLLGPIVRQSDLVPIGLYTRLFTVYGTFVAVAVLINLPTYYKREYRTVRSSSIIVQTTLVSLLLVVAAFVGLWLLSLEVVMEIDFEILRLLSEMIPVAIPITASFILFYIFANLSNLLLAMGQMVPRLTASAAVILVLSLGVVVGSDLASDRIHLLRNTILAVNVALGIGVTILLYVTYLQRNRTNDR